jgi:mersacidin/lichenicidin family type 2 lantibiotic
MSTQEILRAWRDQDYWLSLSEGERARVPENPAGVVELLDEELEHIAGASHTLEFTCPDSCFGTCTGTKPPSVGLCCC